MQVWVRERGVGVCVYGCLHIWVVAVHVWGYVVHVGGECAMYDLGVCVHVCVTELTVAIKSAHVFWNAYTPPNTVHVSQYLGKGHQP